jgi:hypothetical protein
MKCECCGEREAEVRVIDVTDTKSAARQLCAICANGNLRRYEEEMAHEAHARLPDGPTLDAILARAERHGTPDQRRQLALMLRVRAEEEPGRLTPAARAFFARFAPPPRAGESGR